MPVNIAGDSAVKTHPPGSPPDVWLRRITENILEKGLADTSMRRFAKIAGTSHAQLGYYFGSLEGLLGAVLSSLRRRESAEIVSKAPTVKKAVERTWAYYTSPARELEMRLFFYLAGKSSFSKSGHREFVDGVVSTWVAAFADVGTRVGLPEEDSLDQARLLTAALRGLLLDRLLTGDEAATDRAFARLLSTVIG